MQPANLLAFYRTVADRSPLPVILYNAPPFTNYDMPAETIIELADHPNIIGIKESSGDVEKVRRMAAATRHIKRSTTVTATFDAVTPRMMKAAEPEPGNGGGELVSIGALAGATPTGATIARGGTGVPARSAERSSAAAGATSTLKTRQKEVGFQILVGAAQKLHPSLEAGAVGAILAFACPAPTACYEIYAAWKEGDQSLAALKQERILQPAQRVASGLSVPGMKYAMDFNGYYGGPPRLPLLPLTADLKAEVERLMADIRN
jgi:dihydrodipicolinate synthase/N-acetylneuraminate lyase